ncbi:unnamed protein product, partial [Urochloa humidicola]
MYGGGKLRAHRGYLNNALVYIDDSNDAIASMKDWVVEAVPLEQLPNLHPQAQVFSSPLHTTCCARAVVHSVSPGEREICPVLLLLHRVLKDFNCVLLLKFIG